MERCLQRLPDEYFTRKVFPRGGRSACGADTGSTFTALWVASLIVGLRRGWREGHRPEASQVLDPLPRPADIRELVG